MDEVVNEHAAAVILGVAVRTMRQWRYTRQGPTWLKLGPGRMAAVRYRVSDLERFLRDSTVGGGA